MEEIYKNLSLENLENEIWLPIEGFEGLYEVSNLGRVKSLRDNKTRKEKILRQGKRKDGYLIVTLWKEGKVKICYVHRLVAKAFIQNPNGYRCVNHKDECKTNNCVNNLEWCTQKYNNIYGSRLKKVSEKLTNRQDQSKRVYQYSKDGVLVGIWQSTNEAGRNGFNQGHVASCCNGDRKQHRGYIWSYYPL